MLHPFVQKPAEDRAVPDYFHVFLRFDNLYLPFEDFLSF